MPGKHHLCAKVQRTVVTAAWYAATAGEVSLLQLMTMLGPGWRNLRPPTADAMLQQLTLMLQVWDRRPPQKYFYWINSSQCHEAKHWADIVHACGTGLLHAASHIWHDDSELLQLALRPRVLQLAGRPTVCPGASCIQSAGRSKVRQSRQSREHCDCRGRRRCIWCCRGLRRFWTMPGQPGG